MKLLVTIFVSIVCLGALGAFLGVLPILINS